MRKYDTADKKISVASSAHNLELVSHPGTISVIKEGLRQKISEFLIDKHMVQHREKFSTNFKLEGYFFSEAELQELINFIEDRAYYASRFLKPEVST